MVRTSTVIIRRPVTSFVILGLSIAVGAVIMIGGAPPSADAEQVQAVCGNTTSDAAMINNAISGSDPGDEIVIDGPCLINETIKLVGDRSYRGESRTGTVLTQAPGANLEAIFASDSFLDNNPTTGLPISLRQLTINGNRENNTAPTAGIILRSWQSTLMDLQVRSMGGDGIRLTSVSQNGTSLTNTQVNGKVADNFITDSGRHGFHVEDPVNSVTDWLLTDNWIAVSGADGIRMENAAGWFIERNHVYGVPHDAIHAERAFGTSISNNYVEGFGETDAVGTWHGINATVQGGAAATVANNRVFRFNAETGNVRSTFRYLAITRVNYGDGVVTVTGNAIRGGAEARSFGLYYSVGDTQNTSLTASSTGNTVVSVSRERWSRGVSVSSGR